MNDYIFFINLVINAIMNPKVLMKHLSIYAILLNNCICCGFIKIDVFMITYVFLGSSGFPFLENYKSQNYSRKDNESTFINIQVNTIGIHPTLLEAYFQFGQWNVH